jgi:hypothetical protein
MGYYSRIEGEITFSRPLNRPETRAVEAAQDKDWTYYSLITDTEERETDEGTFTILRTTGLEPDTDSRGGGIRAYEWESVLRAMINALPADVTASGTLERTGEESPDMERLWLTGREVHSIKPIITWKYPDGSTEEVPGAR